MKVVGITRRAIALSVDALAGLLLVAFGFAVGLLDPVVFNPEPGWFWTEWWLKHWLDAPTLFTRPVVAWIVLTTSWVGAWDLAVGWTPGDRVARIEVVDQDGDAPHPGRVGLRIVGIAINVATGGLGWLWCFVSPNRRALHDVLSGTFVVPRR